MKKILIYYILILNVILNDAKSFIIIKPVSQAILSETNLKIKKQPIVNKHIKIKHQILVENSHKNKIKKPELNSKAKQNKNNWNWLKSRKILF
jgi:hypothetical protein